VSIFFAFAILGTAAGGAYALMGLGLLTVYRGTGVVNLAQGALGMVGTYVFWTLHDEDGWNLVLAITVAALAVAAGYVAIY
jgi:branched-subunit amino acid ABC-type transport system permease component